MKVIDLIDKTGDMIIADKNRKFYIDKKRKMIGGVIKAGDFKKVGWV